MRVWEKRYDRMGERGHVNWNAIAALAALITAAAAVGMALMLALSIRSDLQRTRFATSLDTLWRLDADWNSPEMTNARSTAATALLADRSTHEIDMVLDFFDEIALLLQRGAVDEELVWYEFYRPMSTYWYASQKYVSQQPRSDRREPWEQLSQIIPRLLNIESQRRSRSVDESVPTTMQIRDFLNAEIDSSQCEDNQEADLRRTPL